MGEASRPEVVIMTIEEGPSGSPSISAGFGSLNGHTVSGEDFQISLPDSVLSPTVSRILLVKGKGYTFIDHWDSARGADSVIKAFCTQDNVYVLLLDVPAEKDTRGAFFVYALTPAISKRTFRMNKPLGVLTNCLVFSSAGHTC